VKPIRTAEATASVAQARDGFDTVIRRADNPLPRIYQMVEDLLGRAVELHGSSEGLGEIFPVEVPSAHTQVVDCLVAAFSQVYGQHQSPLITPHCLSVLGGGCLGNGRIIGALGSGSN
jgi:hypothetical protein